jgi:hypothetical protein
MVLLYIYKYFIDFDCMPVFHSAIYNINVNINIITFPEGAHIYQLYSNFPIYEFRESL